MLPKHKLLYSLFQKRDLSILVWILPLLLLLPLVSHFWYQLERLAELEERFYFIQKKQETTLIRQKKQEAFAAKLEQADHFYLDKVLEPLLFLQNEVALLESRSHLDDEHAKQRLRFLKEGANRLAFVEEKIRRSGQVQEIEERQKHPVEVHEEDLKKILSLVEGTTIPPHQPHPQAPQLLIRDFDLTKKRVSSQEEVYILNMHLIKREILKK